ncbi:DUF2252 domain-containing protein [Aquipuribacter hungaricus]|uniref:DUF2252 domain-containing protein n=1 Tax=Aquipuribacter hungaricus TaxID=545624 RepID=A0ABV7WLV7_9MICO
MAQVPVPAHVVLASADPSPYLSMRDRPTPRAERHRMGRALRQVVRRSQLGDWSPPPDRVDPVALVEESHQGREDWLVPVRTARMAASPYGFLRGSAVVMAADLARLPSTGITPVICGDAHVGNVGFYGSPERELVLDLNDFDEAHPGPWEWDLRRMAASIWVAGRQNGHSEDDCERAVASCSAAYREQVRRLAEQPLMDRSFERLDLPRLLAATSDPSLAAAIDAAASRARSRTSDRALPRFTEERDGRRHIVEEPPLITRLDEQHAEALAVALDEYLLTLDPHWARLLGGYTILDLAHKVVGVGSVGLRAYVALCEGSSPDDVLFLQLKQARRSVVAPWVHGEQALHAHQGQRVVEYQQALQTVSDPLLGWTTVEGRQFYVRQFRNMKGTLALQDISAAAFADYVGICGRLLAKGHARTSGASMIAGYVGPGEPLDRAMCRFARSYADQTERDHAALVAAVRSGRVRAEHGV